MFGCKYRSTWPHAQPPQQNEQPHPWAYQRHTTSTLVSDCPEDASSVVVLYIVVCVNMCGYVYGCVSVSVCVFAYRLQQVGRQVLMDGQVPLLLTESRRQRQLL